MSYSPEDHFAPLPDGSGNDPTKSGKFIDIETFGLRATTAFIITGTLTDLTIDGTLTMAAGGVFRTAASGQRIELTNTNKNRIQFYSGDASELRDGRIAESTTGSGVTRTLQFAIAGPRLEQTTSSQIDAIPSLTIRSGSPNGTLFAPGFVFGITAAASGGGRNPEFRIQNAIPFISDGLIRLSNAGSAGSPTIGFGSNFDDGFYQIADSRIGVTIGGSLVAEFAAGALRLVAGSASAPPYSFSGSPSTGAYLISSDVYGIAVGGANEFTLGAAGFKVPNVYNSTIVSPANVVVVSDGRLYRVNSTEEWKEDKEPWKSDGSILDVQPITFYPMAGNIAKGEAMERCSDVKLVGLTYENMAEHFPQGSQKDNKALDWNAITTALLSEIQQLRDRVTALEAT